MANYVQDVPIQRYQSDCVGENGGLCLRVINRAYEPPEKQFAFFAECPWEFVFQQGSSYAKSDWKSVYYVIRLLAGEPCGSWSSDHWGTRHIEWKRSLADGRSVVQII
jgi:hypothetical protein